MSGQLSALGPIAFYGLSLGAFVFLYALGKTGLPLWVRVLIGLGLGGLAGFFFGEIAAGIKPIGDGFIRLIRMLIVPLVFTTIVAGVIAMGDPKRLGTLGIRTILLYLGTTLFAVTIGLVSGTIFKPGVGVDYRNGAMESQASVVDRLEAAAGAERSVVDQILEIIPENIFQSMVDGDILPIIFFSLVFGVAIIAAGQGAGALGRGMESAAEAILKLTAFIMDLAPYGVYALMAWVLGTQGLDILGSLAKLALALYVACFVHMIIIYGGLIRFVVGLPVRQFFGGILDAMSTSYSTASSSATLPVTIANVTQNLGVERSVAGSVLPLGATINMDGTSIYLGLVALFGAQAVGVDLTIVQMVSVAVTATALSVGTAGIPSASLFLAISLLTGITAGGQSLINQETAILIIALIFPFDRVLDMMRTMTNVTGDAAVATTVAHWEGALNRSAFKKPGHHTEVKPDPVPH
ncbi:proton/glutamate symporter [Parvularcula bermudensis HTCC2503]|uniref:Proton/glutamate symporter n=1 Tax=Parvularcula bermudensis (strain ATCC BAA-594 / HTCC2503 / KCTC 12087) TaxID=314260 RepID=E0TF52_PARBH|nr:dicarboxylate/amino acid:cation symporter [Parvularcula bermudensis]ADM08970.1 proton/glutamate symporter [Parvularcula bermudensis HTCC2503]